MNCARGGILPATMCVELMWISEQLCHNKCRNGGTCQELSAVDYICMCALGFTGRNCQVNIDECVSAPCRQLGVCLDGVNSYTCACMKGKGIIHVCLYER
jgi:hypothetical protein